MKRSYSRIQTVGALAGAAAFLALTLLPPMGGLPHAAQRTLAVALLMTALWLSEAIPMWATGALPLALFPLLGVRDGGAVAAAYGNPYAFLFLGGLFIAAAMERWGLHKRIALAIIAVAGGGPRRLVLGFMCATAFLSLWISNTASTLMIYPIALAVATGGKEEGDAPLAEPLLLGVCYAASIGGLGTLVGTPTNAIFAGVMAASFPDAPRVGFVDWLRFGLPFTLVYLPLAWALLVFVTNRIPAGAGTPDPEAVAAERRAIGRITPPERAVLAIFVGTALLWTFRAPLEVGALRIPGWSELLPDPKAVNDTTVAIFAAALLFLLPAGRRRHERLLGWEEAKHVPWGLILVVGSGFALADAFERTGLSEALAERLSGLGGAPPFRTILAIAVMTTLLSEVAANVSAAALLLPVLAAVARAMEVHPYLLMLPATAAASFGFAMPVATPPNAIVFASGRITAARMARAGLPLDLAGSLLIAAMTAWFGAALLDVDLFVLPDWAR